MTWLGSLPAWAIFPLFAAGTLLLTVALDGLLRRRLIPEEVRGNAGPSAATTLQALATIYAVLVAFVIVDEYSQLRDAQAQVAKKAAALSVIFENSRNLPDVDGNRIRSAALEYARTEVHVGLPTLVRTAKPSRQTDAALERVYHVMATIEPGPESDRLAYEQILTALTGVSETRSNLINSAKATIPVSLFYILAVLGAAVLGVASIMNTRHRRSHLLILGALAVSLSMTLALVAALDYPLHGFIHIDSSPMTQFLENRAAR